MLEYLLQGFLLGLAYLAPIGMQNMYVINAGIRMDRFRAYQVAFFTIVFDVSLALACFFGVGLLLDAFPFLTGGILLIGTIAVTYMGLKLALSKPSLKDVDLSPTLPGIAFACFAVTWFNPQALLDGTMLLGGIRASLPAFGVNVFMAGVALASMSWFTGLATAATALKARMSEKALRMLNVLCGAVIALYGLKLGYELIVLLR
jgi:L-lysine exporter family protein LysE/ArgO